MVPGRGLEEYNQQIDFASNFSRVNLKGPHLGPQVNSKTQKIIRLQAAGVRDWKSTRFKTSQIGHQQTVLGSCG
jgi:hypothetical protein